MDSQGVVSNPLLEEDESRRTELLRGSFLETAESGNYQRLEELLENYEGFYQKLDEVNKSIDIKSYKHQLPIQDNTAKNEDALIGFVTKEKRQNVLHLILKRPPFQQGCDRTSRKSESDRKHEEIEYFLRYMECANVLFDKCDKRVLFDLVNQQDADGNTPLHYAVKRWPQSTVEKLLALGANIAIKNNNGERPLSDITVESLRHYLDTTCIKINNANGSKLTIEDFQNFNGKEKLRKIFKEDESAERVFEENQ